MSEYEVWTSNNVTAWTMLHLETDDREAAKARADALIASGVFRFVAIDRISSITGRRTTIWSNDPDTPAEPD